MGQKEGKENQRQCETVNAVWVPIPTAASLTAGRKEKPTRILLLRDVELAL